LWRLLFDRLTNRHGLHNLIWVYTSGGKPDWYPGDRYVDIVGVDAYPSDVGDALTGDWTTLLRQFNGKKLLALTEFGGVPDVDKMRSLGVRWSYFVSWSGEVGPKKMNKETLARIYRSPAVLNRDDLPRYFR
jgi:mannan endo-1,4-beta-mannosidase